MPWHIGTSDTCPASKPYAVIKADGEVEGCHESREKARRQMAALYASESAKAVLSSAARENLPDSAFACPEKRLYPHHKADGSLDLVHLRNALSRVNQEGTDSCGKAHLEAHAKAEGIGDRGKAIPVKAQMLSEDHFRVLAIPFGGPFDGKDLDGEYFSTRTDIKPDWFDTRPVLWHHGRDDTLRDAVIGKATDLTREDDGWWVDVWLKRGQKYAEMVAQLAAKTPLYGSSGTIGYLKKTAPDGEILVWPYAEQTLTLAPSNLLSISRPAKALLADFDSADIYVSAAFKALLTDLDNLGADLPLTSMDDGPSGDAEAKAGRVLSARNERELRELVERFLFAVNRMVDRSDEPPTEGDASP